MKLSSILKTTMADIAARIKTVREKIAAASAKRPPELHDYFEPRVVAVSKTIPPPAIINAYKIGHRHFGENYVAELLEKGNHPDILSKCQDIRWHFIGTLQSNKINKVLAVPHLYVVETVHSKRLATALDNAWSKLKKFEESRLRVMVQINTSGEEGKSGCKPKEASDLVQHVIENCKHLEFTGVMTIGMYGFDPSNGPNPDFIRLRDFRENICKKLNLDSKNFELSMGMSTDFEHAIELGSTNVRIGSLIFGDRPKRN